ncbi:MAG: class I SAM-dependent methyltransferase, partial [Thermodesulfovibrionales bacterium]|nr:class I SAM-dependent methyltransferase [Thermodesulfovibrionales bacterium]
EKMIAFGEQSRGVDWNGEESHRIRFEQLTKILYPINDFFSINDLGCGYGALIDYLDANGFNYRYFGYDISDEMIKRAKSRFFHKHNCNFYNHCEMNEADYTIANGIFNVRLDVEDDKWLGYILKTLALINEKSTRGFAFNILTSYSDAEYKKEYLYYADPCFFFDFCKRHFSKWVSLLHDYGLYEFTILVRK